MRPSLKQHWGSALPPSYMCDWAVRTDKAGHQDWESNFQHYSDIGPISFFFFFFLRYDTQLKINEKRLLFRNTPYWGRCKTPYLHCLVTFDVWCCRQKSSNEKWEKCQDSHNGHKPTVYNAFSLISGHFCHDFFPFFADISGNSQPIFM